MKYSPEDGFPYYFNLVNEANCLELFSSLTTTSFLKAINETKAEYRYAPAKWSIKQIVGHITDHERIMLFRAFLLSRNEQVELWGYDQNALVDNSRFNELSYSQLLSDFENVRKSSISFIEGLAEEQLEIKGRARQHEITLDHFLKSIIGHEMHHVTMLKEKYI